MIPADRLDLTYGSNRTVRIGGQGHNETITVTSSNTTGILDYFFFSKVRSSQRTCNYPLEDEEKKETRTEKIKAKQRTKCVMYFPFQHKNFTFLVAHFSSQSTPHFLSVSGISSYEPNFTEFSVHLSQLKTSKKLLIWVGAQGKSS